MKMNRDWRGVYLYVIEGGSVQVNGHLIATFGAAKVVGETDIHVKADAGADIILVDVHLS